MMGLVTPRGALSEAIKAAKADPASVPEGGLTTLYAVRLRILERGLLDMAMTSSSVEALLDEVTDQVLKPEPAIDYDRIHGVRGKDWIIQ